MHGGWIIPVARKSERTITLALSALSSPVDRAAPSERAARWVWDAVSQGSANRKEGHCERKYNREMESRDPIEGQTWPDWTSARRTREERICSDWKLIRVVSGPRRTTRKVGRIVGSVLGIVKCHCGIDWRREGWKCWGICDLKGDLEEDLVLFKLFRIHHCGIELFIRVYVQRRYAWSLFIIRWRNEYIYDNDWK